MTDVNIAITTGVGADTYLTSGATTVNLGIYVSVAVSQLVGLRRTLLRFDFSGIPAGRTCTSAVLKLTPTADVASAVYNLYKISDANGDWVEGTKNNATAGAGEPCWNAKFADGAGGVTTAWAGSGGCSTAGTDYIDTVIGSMTSGLTQNTQCDIVFNAHGLSVLQSWFGLSNNNGMLFTRGTDAVVATFHSGEATTTSYRPILTVSYTDTKKFLFKKVVQEAGSNNMIVEGAGTTEFDGTYVESGTYNGKPQYLKDGVYMIRGDIMWGWAMGTSLSIDSEYGWNGVAYYYGHPGDVATPDLIISWGIGAGVSPAPTVTVG